MGVVVRPIPDRLSCWVCGMKFRSMSAEAKHRHNFPALCKRNKRFIAWQKENQKERDDARP